MKVVFTVIILMIILTGKVFAADQATWWQYQSIDTMKFSRDLAREKSTDVDFETKINDQVGQIAATGATHIAIDTPYDEEFFGFLKKWVDRARIHGLKVWFRGNFSGWEGWFDYPKISREEHLSEIGKFIDRHPELFEDGDIFDPCPECENGGPGDPRQNGDVDGFRKFMIDEYRLTQDSFSKINKQVITNFSSSNGDVAKLVYDKETAQAVGGVVAIDHYVATPEQLVSDIKQLHQDTGAYIVLGEFGFPIPDINGEQSDQDQADWIKSALKLLTQSPELIGLNYWTNIGSSTELWNNNGRVKEVVGVIAASYSPKNLVLEIVNDFNRPLAEVKIEYANRTYFSDKFGKTVVPLNGFAPVFKLSRDGYQPKTVTMTGNGSILKISLAKDSLSWWERVWRWIITIFLSEK